MRALYLDLLVKTNCNTISGDPSVTKGRQQAFNPATRKFGQDWPMTAYSMAGETRLENVRQLGVRSLKEGIPGDYIETGV